jgi:predicted GNAT family acetyltransferase
MASLATAGEAVVVVQADELPLPPGFALKQAAALVQMVAARPIEKVADARIEHLGEADAAEMLALATLTRPGPFTLRAQALGGFWGVRIGGRLAAMAGLRLRAPGFYELSGVCTHPDHRGEGLGRLMSLFVAGGIAAGGDTPFLHAYATNEAAIRLYESIGFTLRRAMHVAFLERTA